MMMSISKHPAHSQYMEQPDAQVELRGKESVPEPGKKNIHRFWPFIAEQYIIF